MFEFYKQQNKDFETSVTKEVETMRDVLYEKVSEINDKRENEAQEKNERPCSVCGKKEFIQKFRDVQGEIHGRVSGYYSLFGGSISGYVDGSIHTEPILSCRNCQNERRISIVERESIIDIYETQTPYFFQYLPHNGEWTEWARQFSLEAHYAFCKKHWSDRLENFSVSPDAPLSKKPYTPWYVQMILELTGNE